MKEVYIVPFLVKESPGSFITCTFYSPVDGAGVLV
jgi:hypothetical protein